MRRNSSEFRALQKKWYGKLKDTGFEDIEQDPTDEGGPLERWAASSLRAKFDATKYSAKEEYYRLAGQFLYSHEFETGLEKDIWALHSEGVSVRHTVLRLKKKYWRSHLYRRRVHETVQRLADIMLKEAQSA